MSYDDPESGTGTITYGGVEWMRAGGGVWHGKEMSPTEDSLFQGFQLWFALPPEVENAEPESRYIEAEDMRQSGPAHVIIGEYSNVRSPINAPSGINYLLVTLKPGEVWEYQPPEGHLVGWLALAKGSLDAGEMVSPGEMVVFENSLSTIKLTSTGTEDAVFVLGSAIPHPYPLHMGRYSVHTSDEALERGEQRIEELGKQMEAAGERKTGNGTIPVFR
jgi:redox-sensitive bicupin YhaK (pirin superfamily)